MKILAVHIGPKKQVTIKYEDGTDVNILKSDEQARPEFYDAFGLLAKRYVLELAIQLEEDAGKMIDTFRLYFKDISFSYGEELFYPATYNLKGVEMLKGTVHMPNIIIKGLKFGSNEDLDKAVNIILNEAEKYINGERAQAGLFEEDK